MFSHSVVSNFLQSQGLQPPRLLCPWDYPGKNTGSGLAFPSWGIFPTQGSNPHLLCLLHWLADSLPLSHWGIPSTKLLWIKRELSPEKSWSFPFQGIEKQWCVMNLKSGFKIFQSIEMGSFSAYLVFCKYYGNLKSDFQNMWWYNQMNNLESATLKFLVQFSSVAQSCLTLCDPMNCSTPGLPVHHQLPEFTQTHVHWVRDAIQHTRPLMGKQWKQCQTLFFWAPKSLQTVTAAMKLKDAYSLEGKLWPTQIAYSKAETLLCQQRFI